MVAFVFTLGVLPNVASEHLIFKSMNFGKLIHFACPKIQVFTDSFQETIIMILVKQGMWIIRNEHGKISFKRDQSLLYELNLRSLPLVQS